jgi:oxygen-independent coproporphyrinogen-3 oxidase
MLATTEDRIAKAHGRLADLERLQKLGMICKSGDFFPSVHYPPITMYSEVTEEDLFKTYSVPDDGLFDIYAHIPFCEQRCLFCHYPVKLGQKRDAEKDTYLAAMEREMELYMRRLGVAKLNARSILVGGGTPTFLTPAQLRRFLQFFTDRIEFARCKQFNFDVEPGSLVGEEGLERLHILRDFGVNRLTFGVQSLDDEILKLMNRPHDSAIAIESIRNAQDLGFQVNIEFIFGHPGETLENWIEVMEKAVSLDVEEIQLYRLKVEAYGDYQGPIKTYILNHPERCPGLDDTIVMKQLAIDILAEHGYHENLRRVYTREREHYSHYAHNQCCVLYDEIGLGLTAFSSMRDRFGLNTQYFDEYYRKIGDGQLPLNRGIVRSPEDQMRWAIILPLKNREVRKSLFARRTGGTSLDQVFRKKIEKLKEHGLLRENEKELALTPLGTFFADEVAEQFNAPPYIPYPRSAYADGPLNPYEDNEP